MAKAVARARAVGKIETNMESTMKNVKRWGFLQGVTALALGLACGPAQAGLNLEEGRWRLELNNDFGIYQGSQDRTGDYGLIGFVDYEVPATSRATLGLRLMPLFVFDQSDKSDRRPFRRHLSERKGEGETVWGGGVGVVGRIYQVKDEYRGWYGEASLLPIVHHNNFARNSSNLNFLSTFGVGYQFKSDWHLQVHYQHISNASLGSRNSGTNTVGVGIGYRF